MYSSREKAIKVKDREQQVVFTNFSDEDFEGKWNFSNNHKIWKIKAGQSVRLPFYLAEHFAKHLVNRELKKQGKEVNDPKRQSLLNKCVDKYRQSEQADYAQPEYVEVNEVVLNRDVRGREAEEEHGVKSRFGYNKKALEQEDKRMNEPEEQFEGLEVDASMDNTRAELNEIAEDLGVDNPSKLQNKQEVLEEIEKHK